VANCTSCSAPLPPHSGVCAYCGTASDVDLKVLHEFTVKKPESSRTCPICDLPLQTIDLQPEGRFYIERCERCFGLFFDPGELEALMDRSVANVFAIDQKRIDTLTRERPGRSDPVSYRKCPVCRDLMNRVNFGHRSGVIVDQCKSHGLWLDSGELRRLLDWRKAGGQLLHEEIRGQREQERQRNERPSACGESEPFGPLGEPRPRPPFHREMDLVATLADLFGKLLK
jgi:Zn-finger nucleic acid-binding protein